MTTTFDPITGKKFVLVQDPYLDGIAGTRGYYTASAYSPDDTPDEDGFVPRYKVYWDILEDYDPECGDESNACDWDTISDYDVIGDMEI
ncbi:hypothetical protein [Selenomonas flueggei]|uniref:hypothetical protein n=1 Tax=Selenomonas flueggei TaxID=135080 RepID=UPI002673F742|nr:hypothetical protein [Selenomonas flueggei]